MLHQYLWSLVAAVALQLPVAVIGAEQQKLALESVGRLLVPGVRYVRGYAQHYDERCSGTLITDLPSAQRSDLVLSAWHCIEHYRDLSRRLIFESVDGQRSEAHVLSSGAGMDEDWVLLRLKEKMPSPIYLEPPRSTRTPMEETLRLDLRLLMAGYPKTSDSQQSLIVTTRECVGIGNAGNDIRSNCILQKGASGGAVFSLNDRPEFRGVISRGDGATQSIYVPIERFRARISPFFTAP